MFIHGVCSCDFRTFQIFQCECKNRVIDICLKAYLHLNRKFFTFFDHICNHSGIIPDRKIHDLSKLTAILKNLRIQIQAVFHSPAASGMLFFRHIFSSCAICQLTILPCFCILCTFLQICIIILIHQHTTVEIDHLLGATFRKLFSFVEKNNPIAVFSDTAQVVAYEQNGLTHFLELLEFSVTFCLEKYITYGKRLINDQDLRIDIDGHRKSQTHEHTTGVCFYRLMDKLSNICKIQDRLQLGINLLSGKTDHTSVEIYILKSGIFSVKSCSKLQKSGNPSIYGNFSTCRRKYACDDLQDRRFTRSIGSDDSYCFPFMHLKRYVVQSIVLFIFLFSG